MDRKRMSMRKVWLEQREDKKASPVTEEKETRMIVKGMHHNKATRIQAVLRVKTCNRKWKEVALF